MVKVISICIVHQLLNLISWTACAASHHISRQLHHPCVPVASPSANHHVTSYSWDMSARIGIGVLVGNLETALREAVDITLTLRETCHLSTDSHRICGRLALDFEATNLHPSQGLIQGYVEVAKIWVTVKHYQRILSSRIDPLQDLGDKALQIMCLLKQILELEGQQLPPFHDVTRRRHFQIGNIGNILSEQAMIYREYLQNISSRNSHCEFV